MARYKYSQAKFIQEIKKNLLTVVWEILKVSANTWFKLPPFEELNKTGQINLVCSLAYSFPKALNIPNPFISVTKNTYSVQWVSEL